MADVVNLGVIPRRKSQLHGLHEAIQGGVQTGVNIARTKTDMQNARTQSELLKLKQAELEADINDKNRKGTVETMDRLAMRFAGKNQDFEIFKTSDGGKELSKMVKKYAPEYIGADGSLILPDTKDVVEKKIESQKQRLLEKAEAGTLNPHEREALDRLTKAPVNVISEAIKQALNAGIEPDDPEWESTIKGLVQTLSKNPFTNDLSGASAEEIAASL